MGSPTIPTPAAPPAPADMTAAQLRGLAYAETQRKMRERTGRKDAFFTLDSPNNNVTYGRPPGSTSVLGR